MAIQFWQVITVFGDSAVTVPAGLAVALWLFSARRTHDGWLWLCILALAGVLVGLSKLLFLGWCVGSHAIDFTGISGHTATAALVMPVLVRLSNQAYFQRRRVDGALGGALFAVLIGISRLMVHAHSRSEVGSGLFVGLGLSYTFLRATRGPAPAAPGRMMVSASLLMLAGLLFLVPAPTQKMLEDLASTLSGHGVFHRRADLNCAR